MREDDNELFSSIFKKVGETNFKIWERFMKDFGDVFCVLRFGDDMGFKTSTLLSDDDIRRHIIPQYKPIIDLVHSYGKPFLLHTCGCIFNVFEDLIDAGIDAKHSNEDVIAMFPVWVERYGDRIGNFGGIDTEAVCLLAEADIKKYILEVLGQVDGKGGIAWGSGNSIPDYVPASGFLAMIDTIREYRGDYKK